MTIGTTNYGSYLNTWDGTISNGWTTTTSYIIRPDGTMERVKTTKMPQKDPEDTYEECFTGKTNLKGLR